MKEAIAATLFVLGISDVLAGEDLRDEGVCDRYATNNLTINIVTPVDDLTYPLKTM